LATIVIVAIVKAPIVGVPIMAAAVVPVPAASVVGGLRGPAFVLVAVAQIPGAPVRSPFPGPERVPGRGHDGERRVTPQVRWSRVRCRMIFGTRSGPSRGIGGTGMRRLLRSHLAGRLASGHGTDPLRAYRLRAIRMGTYTRSRGARAAARGGVPSSSSGGSQWREPDDSWSFLPLRNGHRPPAMVSRAGTCSDGLADGLYVEDARPLAAQRGR
jgi:hypothetical protein